VFMGLPKYVNDSRKFVGLGFINMFSFIIYLMLPKEHMHFLLIYWVIKVIL